jgi:hypothetical protein
VKFDPIEMTRRKGPLYEIMASIPDKIDGNTKTYNDQIHITESDDDDTR